ncbi:MAG: GNAT family N-acetyltransferase [Pyrinomonadaceae bacterium]
MTSPNPIIRRATIADAALLADIGHRSFDEAFTPTNDAQSMSEYMGQAFSHAVQAEELADPDNQFFIADIDGVAAGYAMLRAGSVEPGITGDNPIELVRLYALQAWVGRGVGAALMDHCLTIARTSDHDIIWLGVWEFNPRAQAFYRKYGFAEVGTHVFHLGPEAQTDLLMQRAL